MPVYTLGNASMPTTDANVVSRDAITQLQAQAASGVVTPRDAAQAAIGTVSIGEQLANQIAQPAPSRGGALNPSAFDAPRQRSYTSGCGVMPGRPVVPNTGYAWGGSAAPHELAVLEARQRKVGLGFLALGAIAVAAVLAASR